MKNDRSISRILITGGTGSWGHELIRQILSQYHHVKEIRIFSRGEHKQVEMKRFFKNDKRLTFVIGDIRDKDALNDSMFDIDLVFHLAALKHVPVCEENSYEAVKTNIIGTQHVIDAAIAHNVTMVVDVSTDKAVEPFNLYGITKACGEKLMINANFRLMRRPSHTKFICIRGGNVIGTNGSVIPLFYNQLKNKNELTITDPDMTRFLMSTKEAISLLFIAIEGSIGGELFVMRMPSAPVGRIADVMIHLYGNKSSKKKIIGIRPGEKKHEVLISKNEIPFAYEYSDTHYLILPQLISEDLSHKYKNLKPVKLPEYSSVNTEHLSESKLEQLISNEFNGENTE